MIRRLRRSFIAVTMGSVVLVLAVLMGIVNVANYVTKDQSSAELLQVLADNSGHFPDYSQRPDLPDDVSETPPDDSGLTARPNTPKGWSAETPYEMRYFSVTLDESGDPGSVDTGKIAAISSEDAITMAQTLFAEGKTAGYRNNYKYLAVSADSGVTYVFLDCTRDLASVRQFLRYSLLVSLGGVCAIFLLVLGLSKRVVRPISESYEKQKKFITDAGHEIKTPLAIIDSCTEVLELEQGESKWTQGIRSQITRLNTLTQDLVALARMDEHATDLPMEDLDLSELAEETFAPFALMAQSHGLQFTTDIQQGLRLRGNEHSLQQLCSILADNAVKYTTPGGSIRLSLHRKGRRICLREENDAEDLTPGSQKALFDRFYRGDSSRSSDRPGYGIGLSMAQSIVTAHAGKMEAHSRDGKQLTITVLF